MKKIFVIGLIVAFFCVAEKAIAQGTLQFNQTIVYEFVAQTPFAFTVPASKVWKIEAAGGNPNNNPSVYLRNAGGEFIAALWVESSSYRSVLPYWLPSNYSGQFYYSTFAGPEKGSVSIIEFNVIP